MTTVVSFDGVDPFWEKREYDPVFVGDQAYDLIKEMPEGILETAYTVDTLDASSGKGSVSMDEYSHSVSHRKRRPPVGLRMFKHDIRRHYAAMFMIALNSADIGNLLTYFSTFMLPACTFSSEKESVSAFGLPFLTVITGPLMMTNYLLGCYIMSPDLVVMLRNHQITTSNVDTCSRIDLDVEVQYTKLHEVPVELWIPEPDVLQSLYQSFSDDAPFVKMEHVKVEERCGFTTEKHSVGRKRRAATLDASLPVVPCIPERFITHMHDTTLKCPAQSVQERAVISLFLDGNNHLKRIHVTMQRDAL